MKDQLSQIGLFPRVLTMFLLINQYFRDNPPLHLRNFRNFRVIESFINELNQQILKGNFITLTIIIYIILIAALYYNSD